MQTRGLHGLTSMGILSKTAPYRLKMKLLLTRIVMIGMGMSTTAGPMVCLSAMTQMSTICPIRRHTMARAWKWGQYPPLRSYAGEYTLMNCTHSRKTAHSNTEQNEN